MRVFSGGDHLRGCLVLRASAGLLAGARRLKQARRNVVDGSDGDVRYVGGIAEWDVSPNRMFIGSVMLKEH